MTHIKKVNDQVKNFYDNFNAKIGQAEHKINNQIQDKLNKVCENFDNLPEYDKEFLSMMYKDKTKTDQEDLMKMEDINF